jgi:hypothetical protein
VKKLMTGILFLLSMNAFSEVILFKCTPRDIEGIHKFTAKGVVVTDELNNIEGLITLKTEKADATESVQVFEQIKVYGYLKHFNSGDVYSDGFDQLVLKAQDNYIKTINILLDIKTPIVSDVLSIDNFLYRADCQTDAE